MDGHQFKLSIDDIAYLLGVLNEGDVTYFVNVTSDVFLRRYITSTELCASVLKSGV